jgi:hypothetical protein
MLDAITLEADVKANPALFAGMVDDFEIVDWDRENDGTAIYASDSIRYSYFALTAQVWIQTPDDIEMIEVERDTLAALIGAKKLEAAERDYTEFAD